MSVGATVSTQSIQKALAALLAPEDVAELRIPGTRRGTVSGYFTDRDMMAGAAASWNGRAAGIYFTLNPVIPDLAARSAEHLSEFARHTTADQDVLRRRWLPIDCDPVRPSGISSTHLEHEAALDRAKDVARFLVSIGVPPDSVIQADSGNGGHVLVRIEQPNDEVAGLLVDRCLSALDMLFSDQAVSVDTSVTNAARIWKVYGTLVGKGDNTADRPHRIACLIQLPEHLVVAPDAPLQKLAGMAPATDRFDARASFDGFNLDSWISRHGLQVVTTGVWKGGRKWILRSCPWTLSMQTARRTSCSFPAER